MTGLNEVQLAIGGQLYGGWKSVNIERSIENIAGRFRLDVTQRWPGVDVPAQLREGLPCEVRIGGQVVITGYVDEFEPDLTETTSRISVEGRDRTGDLVDCSAVYKTGSWSNVRLERIVRDIAAPFSIPVVVEPGLNTGETFKSFALEDGEKAFDAIDRACRLRSVLCTSTPAGELLLTQASDEHTDVTLEEGVNLKRIRAVHSWKDRYSRVTLKAQAPGDDQENGAAVAHLQAVATDAEINRYRPLIVMAEHHTSSKSLRDRAEWEVKVRMGRGKRGTCTVVGWRSGKAGQEGDLWRPNSLVRVVSPRMHLDRDVLIVGCHFELGEEGQVTHLVFALPEAFELVDGVRRSRLTRNLSDKVERERRRKKGETTSNPWDLTPPETTR